MTYVEQAGIKMLYEFISMAEQHGICFNGWDMDVPVQEMVINIVKDYVNQYRAEDRSND